MTSTAEIVIFGSGGHAKVVLDAVEREGRYRIAGLIDRARTTGLAATADYPLLGSEADLPRFGFGRGIIAVGDNWLRSQIAARVASAMPGFDFVTVVHPSCTIGRDVEIGPGTVILAGACVNPGARIGAQCIVNTRASLDHDVVLADFSSVAPGATLGGNASVGRFSAVGLGASVIHGVSIAEHAVVGAGAVVTRDVEARVVAYGVPCRTVRPRREGDSYY